MVRERGPHNEGPREACLTYTHKFGLILFLAFGLGSVTCAQVMHTLQSQCRLDMENVLPIPSPSSRKPSLAVRFDRIWDFFALLSRYLRHLLFGDNDLLRRGNDLLRRVTPQQQWTIHHVSRKFSVHFHVLTSMEALRSTFRALGGAASNSVLIPSIAPARAPTQSQLAQCGRLEGHKVGKHGPRPALPI